MLFKMWRNFWEKNHYFFRKPHFHLRPNEAKLILLAIFHTFFRFFVIMQKQNLNFRNKQFNSKAQYRIFGWGLIQEGAALKNSAPKGRIF